MQSTKLLSVLMCVMGVFLADATAATINFPGGRIAYSADGNQHDHDDIGATAAAIAMVSSAGLGDKLVHYDFSNHLGNNNKKMENDMIESALGGAKRFGLDTSKFFNDQTQLKEAIANFKKEGNKSSENDPLWYICAGPMEVAWRCVNAVDPEKRKYIHVISHSGWNDKHGDTPEMTHRWEDIGKLGATLHKIKDQNSSNGDNDLNSPLSKWQWLKNSDNENWKWLYSRNQFKDKFDISDSGMMYWLITGGPNGGNQKSGSNELKDLLSNPVKVPESAPARPTTPKMVFSDLKIRRPDGDGRVDVGGDLRQWHKVSLTLNGPYAHERDTQPNPFTDYGMTVTFKHESGEPVYQVPGYFAADGKAGESGADCGTSWRAHLSPDKTGKWSYSVQFTQGSQVAIGDEGQALKPYDGQTGSFVVRKSNKKGRDFRAQGRLQYVGKHHLQFAQSGKYFLKAGPDSPETFLAYEDFDGTYTVKNKLKTQKERCKTTA
ncbi:DUF5060 domain-containing protein [Planctomycetota bacterium]